MARAVLAKYFSGEPLNIMTAICYGECKKHTQPGAPLQGYLDAVGDWQKLDPTPSPARPASWLPYDINAARKWRPSIGHPQIRCLHDPSSGNFADTFRDNHVLHLDADAQAKAAWEISQHGTNFFFWSVFKSGTYLNWLHPQFDFELVTGHPEAHRWNMYDVPPA